jgi:hypothetical protein
MTKLTTLKEMKAEGWTLNTINGVKCLRKCNEGETFIAIRANLLFGFFCG